MIAILLLLIQLVLPAAPVHTPGVVATTDLTIICGTKWGHDRRHVTEAMKREVAQRYGLRRDQVKRARKGPCCEIDHLIPRELGGADDVDNLWPEPWADAHLKDHRENALHRAVCVGTITLDAAQQEMRAWHSGVK